MGTNFIIFKKNSETYIITNGLMSFSPDFITLYLTLIKKKPNLTQSIFYNDKHYIIFYFH